MEVSKLLYIIGAFLMLLGLLFIFAVKPQLKDDNSNKNNIGYAGTASFSIGIILILVGFFAFARMGK